MLLRRRHEGLHEVDIALTAVRLQLHLEAVVAEAVDLHRGQPDAEGVADRACEPSMGTTAEDDDLAHENLAD
jgi:hypothetical protein